MALTREPFHESGVDQRRRLVDATADLADDAVDDPAEVSLVVESATGLRVSLPFLLDVDRVRAVHHDLGDRDVGEQSLERAEAENVVLDLADDATSAPRRSAASRTPRIELSFLADEAH